MKRIKLSRQTVLWLPLAILATVTPAFATQTENHGIHAVPAPGKVGIDGKLDD